jgi:hypothetical protein
MKTKYKLISVMILNLSLTSFFSQSLPEIISNKKIMSENYLPDFSYAGYKYGEKPIPKSTQNIYNATDYGVIANDGLDDSKALIKAITEVSKKEGNVILQLPAGKINLSEIIYIERSNFVLRGMGSGENGTELFFPRPMMYLPDPEPLKELREYLVELEKRQIEKENNINLAFSQYAWSGGYIWTQVPGERVKSYLEKYERPLNILSNVISGKKGEKTFIVQDAKNLKVGDVIELQLFNKDGEKGEIISDLYQNAAVTVGSHHWKYPMLPIVRQQVEIEKIEKNIVTIKSVLTLDIKPSYKAQLVEWKHLREVGIENIKITFPDSPRVAHHVEQGYNAICLTRLFHSWVDNVVIENSDSGILTEEIASVTINNITTIGNHFAHYTVAFGGVHNILAQNIKVYNASEHPLSFNTFSTKSVYRNCEVFNIALLDQHSGCNHQNLFDNITVYINPKSDNSYPLFCGGGAPYWKPSHGAYSTFWNINVLVKDETNKKPVLLNGILDGPYSRIIGVHGNREFSIKYEPKPYIEKLNEAVITTPSLYDYQLKKRLK